ncbi:uncharacterized protein Dwil_GK26767 [Drosophila willistoni]|uniref:BPTI/Kunitz inhibitor domain-containing protein n=1 Tax=Drosophila willistoni TaxID=7260 RepID=A0A0Q9X2L1_DROWI|nr:kunitz-like peptide PcKuz1 [Drosophila willistoni]KRF98460.1 uncharacterized protein Dwil_GK26767 [Drosophila willistoni]
MKFLAIFCLVCALFSLSSAGKYPVCDLPVSANGPVNKKCVNYVPKYTYDAQYNICRRFIYGGCGGNANRFDTLSQCEAKCKF